MKKPTTFEKKLKKLIRKENTCRNYASRCGGNLTEYFWCMLGGTFQEMLDDMQNNYEIEWKAYCKAEGLCWMYNVGDAMC